MGQGAGGRGPRSGVNGQGARSKGPGSRVQGQGAKGKDQGKSAIKGFTLIELTIVIVILGVMLSLVIPRLGEIGEADLRRSARHLTGTIRFLRDEAQAKKVGLHLRFDVTEGRYWVEVFTPLSNTMGEFRRYSSEVTTESRLAGQTAFRDIKVAGHPDDPYILFTPDGWVEKAFIHLVDGDDRPFTLVVNPLTGNTELREGYVEER